jgi:phage terminase large subunit-like protein
MDFVGFVDRFVTHNEKGKPFRLEPHQRDILRTALTFDAAGRLPCQTFLYACPKKSGKTFINALVVLWWAFTQEAPNVILVVANDLEQAQSRVFATIAGLIRHNPVLRDSATVQAKLITLETGTTIRAIASDYAGAAGSDHGLVSFDELWGYTSEAARRLWEELTPVPTRNNSVRFITTYAGFEGESALLWDLYLQGVGPEEHPGGHGVRRHATLPLYDNLATRQWTYWDHDARMPWQTPDYYATERGTLRRNAYLRLHENRWTSSEDRFISPALWDACIDPNWRPLLPTTSVALYVGVDVGIRRDCSAVVAVYRDADRVLLATHRIWRPTPEEPIDLEATVEAYVRQLRAQFRLAEVLCDPYQMERSIATLRADKFPIKAYDQTTENTTRMGRTLFELLHGRNLVLYADADLREHALHTVARETPRGWRIAKESAGHPIDAMVALAMAAIAALRGPTPAERALTTWIMKLNSSEDGKHPWPTQF